MFMKGKQPKGSREESAGVTLIQQSKEKLCYDSGSKVSLGQGNNLWSIQRHKHLVTEIGVTSLG